MSIFGATKAPRMIPKRFRVRCLMGSDILALSGLRDLTKAERQRRISDFLQSTSNGAASEIAAEISQIEAARGMSSETMLQRLQAGAITETEEIGHWIMLLKMLNRA